MRFILLERGLIRSKTYHKESFAFVDNEIVNLRNELRTNMELHRTNVTCITWVSNDQVINQTRA